MCSLEAQEYLFELRNFYFVQPNSLKSLKIKAALCQQHLTKYFSPEVRKFAYGNDGNNFEDNGTIPTTLYRAVFHRNFVPQFEWFNRFPRQSLQHDNLSIIPLGYPKIDYAHRIAQDTPSEKLIAYVMLPTSSSHMPYPFHENYSIIDRLLHEFPDYKILIRPRIEDFKKKIPETLELIESYRSNPRIEISMGPYAKDYGRSSIAILNGWGSSVRSYPFITENPLIILRSLNGNSETRESWHGYRTSNLKDLILCINSSLQYRDRIRDNIIKYRGDNFINFGCSAEYLSINLEYILEDKEHPDWIYQSLYSHENTIDALADCRRSFENLINDYDQGKNNSSLIRIIIQVYFDIEGFHRILIEPDVKQKLLEIHNAMPPDYALGSMIQFCRYLVRKKEFCLANDWLSECEKWLEEIIHPSEKESHASHIASMRVSTGRFRNIEERFNYIKSQGSIFKHHVSQSGIWSINKLKNLEYLNNYSIYGTGNAALFILNYIDETGLKRPEYVIDDDPQSKTLDRLPIVGLNQAAQRESIPILIPSTVFEQEISSRIRTYQNESFSPELITLY